MYISNRFTVVDYTTNTKAMESSFFWAAIYHLAKLITVIEYVYTKIRSGGRARQGQETTGVKQLRFYPVHAEEWQDGLKYYKRWQFIWRKLSLRRFQKYVREYLKVDRWYKVSTMNLVVKWKWQSWKNSKHDFSNNV